MADKTCWVSTLAPLIPVVVMVAGQYSQQIQDWLSAHPGPAVLVAGLYALLAHFLPSPVKGGK